MTYTEDLISHLLTGEQLRNHKDVSEDCTILSILPLIFDEGVKLIETENSHDWSGECYAIFEYQDKYIVLERQYGSCQECDIFSYYYSHFAEEPAYRDKVISSHQRWLDRIKFEIYTGSCIYDTLEPIRSQMQDKYKALIESGRNL